MTKIQFSKYNGCGNDFICIDCRDLELNLKDLAIRLCSRKHGIGADGIVAVFSSDLADLKMVIVNSDGSIPEMCGNGLRCLMAFVLDTNIFNHSLASIETGAGILRAELIESSSDTYQIRVNMGPAMYGDRLPKKDFLLPNLESANFEMVVNDQILLMYPVSMGNPHVVTFVDDVDKLPLDILGPQIETHSYFPNFVNTEFIQVKAPDRLKMRVWERGVGETDACGTGACASVVASYIAQLGNGSAIVELNGGQLFIQFDPENHEVIMEGPVEFEFKDFIVI